MTRILSSLAILTCLIALCAGNSKPSTAANDQATTAANTPATEQSGADVSYIEQATDGLSQPSVDQPRMTEAESVAFVPPVAPYRAPAVRPTYAPQYSSCANGSCGPAFAPIRRVFRGRR